MSSYPYKGQKVLHELACHQAGRPIGGATSLNDQKLAAWEIAVGGRSPTTHPPGRVARAHRGNLPDVDLSLAVPFPTKPSRVTVIAGWVGNVFREQAREERRRPLVRSL
jgi:hypothetical protein